MDGTDIFLIDLRLSSYETFTITNNIFFYIVNWLGLFIMIVLFFKIRHTGDDTYLRLECGIIVGVWVVFSVLQYGTYIFNSVISC